MPDHNYSKWPGAIKRSFLRELEFPAIVLLLLM
jgi:hypothetical protein